MSALFFSKIDVTRQVFYRTKQAFAIVNLKPIVPGHVLVMPTRCAARLTDLSPEEMSALFHTVQRVGREVEKAFHGSALTIACQDGKAAGQSVPHVHVHIMPRRLAGDRFEGRNDDIYTSIEKAENELGTVEPLHVDDENRKGRTVEEMEREAEWLRSSFTSPA